MEHNLSTDAHPCWMSWWSFLRGVNGQDIYAPYHRGSDGYAHTHTQLFHHKFQNDTQILLFFINDDKR